MPVAKELGQQPPSDGGVRWAVKPQELAELALPTPTLWKERALVASVDGHEIGVGVFALPPKESTASRFWAIVKGRRGDRPDPVRLKIEPPVPMTDFKRGEHTRLSAIHPYVVMEDDSQYGIGLWVPRGLYGEWSEPQERKSQDFMGGDEVFQQRQVPAVLLRLDGTTPLAGRELPSGQTQEMLLGLPQPQGDGDGDVAVLLTKRQLAGVRKKDDDADAWDLTFDVVAERGTGANAAIGDKGLVQVIVVQTTEDRVIEKIPPVKLMGGIFDEGYGSQSLRYGTFAGFERGATKGVSTSDTSVGTNSTVMGETRFTGRRREKVSIESVAGYTPVAEFNFVLVGNGGAITAEMTEAPMPHA